ncbi:hypothetical protein [Roseobacter litoralis]|uniref:hypothetical protein n=1 Tax=Roseobacter litoralis TaxID=42443 RepID=UPI00249552C1|nr:hypothetical protein [Roseobacter litoralis]
MSNEIDPASYFTDMEREAIILNATLGMIDDMVNHTIFMPLGENRQETNLLPTTQLALVQFSTLLRDFLSPVTSRGKQPLPFGLPKPPNGDNLTDHTTLFYLKQIGKNPLIGTKIEPLNAIVLDFADWLNETAIVPDIWLPSISTKLDLEIKRIDFIRTSGDIGKHNFLRLEGQARRVRRVLSENDVEVDLSEAYLALPDLWDWFHTHLLAFHASNIAEFLNNIRYAVRSYVGPLAKTSYRVIDAYGGIERYTFERPDEIVNSFAWEQYYGLLQSSLRQPNFPKFSVSPSFKTQF